MLAVPNPKANPENLLALVRGAAEGKVVLPDFQRSFVWARDDVRELLVSVLYGYFIGTFLMLDTDGSAPMFPTCLVAGVKDRFPSTKLASHPTIRLVLDGQQRLTALFYALYAPSIPLAGSKYPYRFYLDLEAATEMRFDDAVLAVSDHDNATKSMVEARIAKHLSLPFTRLLDTGQFVKWIYSEQSHWDTDESRSCLVDLQNRLGTFLVPVVALAPDTGEANIVTIFERINRTGVSLSLYDLIRARLYPRGLDLAKLWSDFPKGKSQLHQTIRPETILRTLCLLEGREPKKVNLLDLGKLLEPALFRARWDEACKGIELATARAASEYGSFASNYLPYTTLLPPLAALLSTMKTTGSPQEAFRKLDTWYWAAVFSQRYESASDSKSQQDVMQVGEWLRGGFAPDWIGRLQGLSVDLDTEEPRSAVFRGALALCARRGCRDFWTGQNAPLSGCHDDHVFPRALYAKGHAVETLANKAILSAATNQKKSKKPPSAFMDECLKGHGGDETALYATLETHFINENAYLAMLLDDFEEFVSERRRALVDEVARLVTVPVGELRQPATIQQQSSAGPFELDVLSADAKAKATGRVPVAVSIDGITVNVGSWRALAVTIVEHLLAQAASVPVPFQGGRSERNFLAPAPVHPDGSPMQAYQALETPQGTVYLHQHLSAWEFLRRLNELCQQSGLPPSQVKVTLAST